MTTLAQLSVLTQAMDRLAVPAPARKQFGEDVRTMDTITRNRDVSVRYAWFRGESATDEYPIGLDADVELIEVTDLEGLDLLPDLVPEERQELASECRRDAERTDEIRNAAA